MQDNDVKKILERTQSQRAVQLNLSARLSECIMFCVGLKSNALSGIAIEQQKKKKKTNRMHNRSFLGMPRASVRHLPNNERNDKRSNGEEIKEHHNTMMRKILATLEKCTMERSGFHTVPHHA